jgi:hypothetical protein
MLLLNVVILTRASGDAQGSVRQRRLLQINTPIDFTAERLSRSRVCRGEVAPQAVVLRPGHNRLPREEELPTETGRWILGETEQMNTSRSAVKIAAAQPSVVRLELGENTPSPSPSIQIRSGVW